MHRMTRPRMLISQIATPGWKDRGAVAVIVSVLLASGVLLGMAALSVDVGQLMAEREELMSAADGAAQSIAIDCSKNPANCASAKIDATVAKAQGIANANGKDGLNDVTYVCGRGGDLAACDPSKEPTNVTACLNTPPSAGINYVEVHTATRTKTSTVLPTTFASSFVSGYKGTTVAACSRVEWGSPGGGLSVTFAECEWANDTANGTKYYDFPPNPPASAEQVIYLHGSKASSCNNNPPSGWDAPGGFGWLDQDTSSTCYTTILAGGSYPGNTGSDVSSACQQAVVNAQKNHTPILIPIYDGTKGSGSKLVYHAYGVAAFVVTGFYFDGSPADNVPSWLTGRQLCDKNEKCIYGFFVSPILDASTPISPSNPDLGPLIVKTVG
jgi:Flp pilus assembly protein TadG